MLSDSFVFYRVFGKYIILLMSCFYLVNCGLLTSSSSQSSAETSEGVLSGNIEILIAPYGERPLVFTDAKSNAICRKGYPSHAYGLEPEEVEGDELEQSPDDLDSEGNSVESEAEELPSPSKIFTDVNEGWFKIGLHFGNWSSYYLVVESLRFTMSANWGDEILTGSKEISSYCDSDPLYIIPPQTKVVYNPDRSRSMGNLQIYVDGLPIPTAAPQYSETQSETDADAPPTELQNQSRHPEVFQLTYLPSYRVQLLVVGHFMDERRNYVGNFTRKLIFYTSSKF